MDELVGALHGFHEPLLFFRQCADDPETHIFDLIDEAGKRVKDSVFQAWFSLANGCPRCSRCSLFTVIKVCIQIGSE
jgi:hypothetical protein